MVRSTSVSGPIQCDVGPAASNSGFWIHPIMQTFTSGWVFPDPGVGGLLSFPCPFGICLLTVPLPKCFTVGAASCEMARRPTHETLLLLSLVAAHCLSQVHIETNNRFYFRLGVLPCDRISQCQPLLLQGCHSAHWCWIVPVLVSIHL